MEALHKQLFGKRLEKSRQNAALIETSDLLNAYKDGTFHEFLSSWHLILRFTHQAHQPPHLTCMTTVILIRRTNSSRATATALLILTSCVTRSAAAYTQLA